MKVRKMQYSSRGTSGVTEGELHIVTAYLDWLDHMPAEVYQIMFHQPLDGCITHSVRDKLKH
jgi:hypothetical protein